jgi:hypothetical protein
LAAAAVGNPDPSDHAVPGLHGVHDRLQSLRIVSVAGEHFVAEWKAVKGHHQRDAHLLAVGPMIARVTAPGLRIGLRLALKIGARHLIEQHLVVDGEQLSAALRQMRFDRRLVRQQMIEPAVEPVLVDGFVAKLQQIAQRRAAIPVLGDVQLARRLAEPRCHQNGRHLRPRDPLLARRKQAFAHRLKPHPTPQRQRQIDVAESARTLDADTFETNRHRHIPAAIVEQ